MSILNTTENPKEYLGREKDCIQYVPMRILLGVARVFRLGAEKYGQKNWRVQPVRMSTYYNAAFRHMVDWFEGGEDLDPESQQHHLLHTIACCLIVLDGIERKSIADDRTFAEVKTGKLADPEPKSTTMSHTANESAAKAKIAMASDTHTRRIMARAIDPEALAKFEADAREGTRRIIEIDERSQEG